MQEPLIDGGAIRKLWIGDADIYRDHLLRLDAESRRNRFGGAVSDEFIRNYVDLPSCFDAVIHGFFVDGVLRGAAELRPLGSMFPDEAEAAFSIERSWQSHGVGTALLDRTLLTARNRGIKLLHQRQEYIRGKILREIRFFYTSRNHARFRVVAGIVFKESYLVM